MNGYKDIVGTVLDKLTDFASAAFVRSTLFPLTVALVVNGVIWRFHSGVSWIGSIPADEAFTTGSVGAVLLALVAACWAALLPVMRDALRGRYLPSVVRSPTIHALEQERLRLNDRMDDLIGANARIVQKRSAWIGRLATARRTGDGFGPGLYPTFDGHEDPAHEAAGALRTRSVDESEAALETAVRLLEASLSRASARDIHELAHDHELVLRAIDVAGERLTAEIARIASHIESHYPDGELAPTRFGNVTRTVSSYAEKRYGIDFDFWWSRIRSNVGDARGEALERAQAEVDFFVSLVWLSPATVAVWSWIVLQDHGSPWLFLGIAVAGPMAALGFYRMAIRTNGLLAELLRTTLDFDRRRALTALGLTVPTDSDGEKALWEIAQLWLAYGQRSPITFKEH